MPPNYLTAIDFVQVCRDNLINCQADGRKDSTIDFIWFTLHRQGYYFADGDTMVNDKLKIRSKIQKTLQYLQTQVTGKRNARGGKKKLSKAAAAKKAEKEKSVQKAQQEAAARKKKREERDRKGLESYRLAMKNRGDSWCVEDKKAPAKSPSRDGLAFKKSPAVIPQGSQYTPPSKVRNEKDKPPFDFSSSSEEESEEEEMPKK